MATRRSEDTVLEAKKSRTKPPSMFKVMLLNDDYTPMDFVVLVLQKYFLLSRERATQVMLKVHREGMGICGIYPKDVAATKVEHVQLVRETAPTSVTVCNGRKLKANRLR